MFEHCYFLTVDGGALLQGSADSAGYGSFCLEARTGQRQTIRLDFGRRVTNNEAEYDTLIAALEATLARLRDAGLRTQVVHLADGASWEVGRRLAEAV